MPLRASNAIFKLEPGSMRSVDTREAENFFGLWSVFSKCSESLEDGKRLENISWRLWSRETFCCAPDHQSRLARRWHFDRKRQAASAQQTGPSATTTTASAPTSSTDASNDGTVADSDDDDDDDAEEGEKGEEHEPSQTQTQSLRNQPTAGRRPAERLQTSSTLTGSTISSSAPPHPDSPPFLHHLSPPELSSSVETTASADLDSLSQHPQSWERRCRRAERHITPIDLEKIVISIKEKKELHPLSPLRMRSCQTFRAHRNDTKSAHHHHHPNTSAGTVNTNEKGGKGRDSTGHHTSAATATASSSRTDGERDTVTGPHARNLAISPPARSDSSTSTDMSSQSIVRGFSIGRVASSCRSQLQLSAAAADDVAASQNGNANVCGPAEADDFQPESAQRREEGQRHLHSSARSDSLRRKGAKFQLGCSSDEGGDSSVETRQFIDRLPASVEEGSKKTWPSALTTAAAEKKKKKQASFKDGVATRLIPERAYESEDAIESEDEVSESAIDDDDDDDDDDEEDEDAWEDSETEDGRFGGAANEGAYFQRVDSRPNLVSRRSLLTTMMHEKERRQELATAATRATPAAALRRSRTSSPNGPSLATSAQEDVPTMTVAAAVAAAAAVATNAAATAAGPRGTPIPRPRPTILTTSNAHPPALSPRTTRRNMLTTELTESLRKHILWERQQKNVTANAALKRRHTSHDVKNLRQYPGEKAKDRLAPVRESSMNCSLSSDKNNGTVYDQGLQEYHETGW